MLVARLDPSHLRLEDPFVRAVVEHSRRLGASMPERSPRQVRGYLAGGIGVRCCVRSRTTGDVDLFFTGGRLLMPPNTAILVRVGEREHGLVLDQQYTPDFGLLHPDHTDRAVELSPPDRGLALAVLHPLDLVIPKIARFQDHDREDIAALADTRSCDAEVVEIVAASQAEPSR